jgi:hypothetical protein
MPAIRSRSCSIPRAPTAATPTSRGTATVEKLTIKGTFNGMVEASLSFKGNGALGKSTV